MRALARIACALFLALSAVGGVRAAASAAPPGAGQLVSWSQLCAEVTAGRFVWKSGTPAQCSSLPNRIIAWADFTGAVNSSGCASGNPLPTYQGLLNCRTLAGLVSASVSGSSSGFQPLHCVGPAGDQTCTGPTAAAPLDTSTSSTTTNPSASFPISWNITPSSVGGTCTLTLYHGGSAVLGPFTLSQSVANSNSYSSGAGSGVYTLEVASTTNNGSCTVSGTLSWNQ